MLDNQESRRCGSCPAFWQIKGPEDWDEGCRLRKDDDLFCVYIYLPEWIVDLRIQIYEWKEFIRYKLSERKEKKRHGEE